MLKQLDITPDSQPSHNQLANILMQQALEQLMSLSNLSKEECLALMQGQFSVEKKSRRSVDSFILEQEESQFIQQLFN